MKDFAHIYTGQDNAMTEIALALAMGFFSLMVLTLVSMGTGRAEPERDHQYRSVPIARTNQPHSDGAAVSKSDTFIIYAGGSFFDSKGEPLQPETLNEPEDGRRLVLVISPKRPLSEIMQARDRLPEGGVVVAEMDEAWASSMRDRGIDP